MTSPKPSNTTPTDSEAWGGYWPALTTPFTQSGALDETAWRETLHHMSSIGIHGALVNGSSGEWFSQTTQERRRVAEIAVEEANGDYTIVVGCSGYTPDQVLEVASHAADVGADGILFTPPPYARPDEREILEFYRTVVGRAELQTMVYNWPRGTGVDMSTELMASLAALPGVKAIKDSTPDYGAHLGTLQRLGGKSEFFANYISRLGIGVLSELGGHGSIEGGALCAADGIAFYKAYWQGDLEGARRFADRYEARLQGLIGENFAGRFGTQIPQIKAAMRMMGQPGGFCRSPYRELDADQTARLRKQLIKLELL